MELYPELRRLGQEKLAGDMAALAETPLNAGKKRTH